MFEMRWLCNPRNDVDRVLQYRYQFSVSNINPFKPNDEKNVAELWTDWKTVEEVNAPPPQSRTTE